MRWSIASQSGYFQVLNLPTAFFPVFLLPSRCPTANRSGWSCDDRLVITELSSKSGSLSSAFYAWPFDNDPDFSTQTRNASDLDLAGLWLAVDSSHASSRCPD